MRSKFSTIRIDTNVSNSAKPSENAAEVPRQVAYWLFGVSGLIFGLVTVGGITRLTRSGLSMTDWKLQGSLPPLNEEQWQIEFDRSLILSCYFFDFN